MKTEISIPKGTKECPICFRTGIEYTLHAGSITCSHCKGKGYLIKRGK